jgi:O-antigen/teichoic acid export membrane protein
MIKRLVRWADEHPARAAAIAGWYQQGVGVVSALIVLPMIIEILGAEKAGQWFALQGFVMLVGLSDFGFSMVISRQVAFSLERRDGDDLTVPKDLIGTDPGWLGVRQIVGASKLLFLRVQLVAAALAILLYYFILPRTGLAFGVSAESAIIWSGITIGVLIGFQARLNQAVLEGIGRMAIGRLITGTHQGVVNIGCAAVLCIWPSLVSMSLFVFVASLFLFFCMKRALRTCTGEHLHGSTPPNGELDNRLWRVALPLGFVNSGAYLVGAAQVPLLGALLGPLAVTPYYVALRVSQALYTAVTQLTTPQLPFFTGDIAAGRFKPALERLQRTVIGGTSLHLAAALFLYFCSPFIAHQFLKSGHYLQGAALGVFSVNHFVSGAAVVVAHFVLASGRNPFALSTLIQGGITIGGILLLAPRIGIVGVPVASLISTLLTNFWYSLLQIKRTHDELRTAIPTLQSACI